MEKLTITRALAELKLISSKIEDKINNASFCDIYQKRSNKGFKLLLPKDRAELKIKEDFQSIEDLIKRKILLKNAILRNNSLTQVTVKNKTFTVAEAIAMKTLIADEETFLKKLQVSYGICTDEIEKQKATLDGQVEKMLTQNLGSDKKTNKEDYDNIAKPFIEANEYCLIDPLDIKNKIDEKDNNIKDFLSEIDFVLSESNSQTYIEI